MRVTIRAVQLKEADSQSLLAPVETEETARRGVGMLLEGDLSIGWLEWTSYGEALKNDHEESWFIELAVDHYQGDA